MPRPTAADLPLLWPEPPALGHDGGPPLDDPPGDLGPGAAAAAREPRRRGRPSLATPALQEAVLDLLLQGVPLRAICRAPGFPGRATLYRWRRADPGFDFACAAAQAEGYVELASRVAEEVERVPERGGLKLARHWFNLRSQQLARMALRVFGGP